MTDQKRLQQLRTCKFSWRFDLSEQGYGKEIILDRSEQVNLKEDHTVMPLHFKNECIM